MTGLKIEFSKKKIDRVAKLLASKGKKAPFPVFCARTFQGLHSERLWTPTIFINVLLNSKINNLLLQIEVVNGKKNIYYCNFRVYLVTGPIEGR
jgi:hypothetical protein